MGTLTEMLEAYKVGRIPLDRREEKQVERLDQASSATQKSATLRAKIAVAARALEEATADERTDLADTIHQGILDLTEKADHAEAEAEALHTEYQEESREIGKESNALADKILAEVFPSLKSKAYDALRAAITSIEEIDTAIHEFARKTGATLSSKHREQLLPLSSSPYPEEKALSRAINYWIIGTSGARLTKKS